MSSCQSVTNYEIIVYCIVFRPLNKNLLMISCLGLASVENSVISSLTQLLGQDLEKVISKCLSPLGESLSLYVGPRASSFQLKSYPSGLVTLNIDYWLEEGEKPLLSLEVIKNLAYNYKYINFIQKLQNFRV